MLSISYVSFNEHETGYQVKQTSILQQSHITVMFVPVISFERLTASDNTFLFGWTSSPPKCIATSMGSCARLIIIVLNERQSNEVCEQAY